jgi:hypothetical protein
MTPWLPEELKGYEVARKALGVVLRGPGAKPVEDYKYLYRDKVRNLLDKALENGEPVIEEIETYLGPQAVYWLPKKPEANELLHHMEASDEVNWRGPYLALSLYLQKRGSLQEVRDALGLEEREQSPVSEAEFLEELKSLSLGEFLELVT